MTSKGCLKFDKKSNVKVCNTFSFRASLYNGVSTSFNKPKRKSTMIGYMSTIVKETLNDRYAKLRFLIGEYDVTAYNSVEANAWVKAGRGTANYTLEDNFITEKVEIYRKNSVIAMHNTIGCDFEKDSFNMQTLDYTSGHMDFYKGCMANEIIVFCNNNSEIKAKNEFGDSFYFKLIYKQLSELENELIVGYSKDSCKTWSPYIKNIYTRK